MPAARVTVMMAPGTGQRHSHIPGGSAPLP